MMARQLSAELRLLLLKSFARLYQAPSPGLPTAPPCGRKQSRILVIRPDHLGDILLITPALRVLRQRHPDAHITALVGPWGAPVLSGNPNLDELIQLPFPGFTRRTKPSLWQPYRLLWQWRSHLQGQYTTAYILRFDHWWGALLAYVSGIPDRVGYQTPETTPFLTRALPRVSTRHEVLQNLALIDAGLANRFTGAGDQGAHMSSEHPLQFELPDPARAWSGQLLQGQGAIAIHPGTGAAIKLWPPEHWAALAEALHQKTGLSILLTGSESERSLSHDIARQMTAPARVIAGQTSLQQLAALFARCQLVIGPDSGPLHLATAVGTPTVHLYGPVDWKTFGPWGTPERHRVVTSQWPCIPCNRLDYASGELAHHPCVRAISVSQVLQAAEQVLAQRKEA